MSNPWKKNILDRSLDDLANDNQINFKKLESSPKDHVIADHYGSIEVDIKKLDKII